MLINDGKYLATMVFTFDVNIGAHVWSFGCYMSIFLANSYVLEENYGLQRAAEVRSSSAVS